MKCLFARFLVLSWFCLLPATSYLRCGATTNFNWIATSPADYSLASDWDLGTVPGGGDPGFNDVALFTNGIACNYYSNSSAVLDNDWVGQMSLGAWNSSSGKFVLNGGTLLVSNTLNNYAVTIGGTGRGKWNGWCGIIAIFRRQQCRQFHDERRHDDGVAIRQRFYHQDSFILGLATNSSGTFTLNGGTANFLCGVELAFMARARSTSTAARLWTMAGLALDAAMACRSVRVHLI